MNNPLNKYISQKINIFLICLLFGSTIYAQECNVIYVATNGIDSGIVGTKSQPTTLLNALAMVNATNKVIYMASGTYNFSNPINLISDVTIEGGFDAVTWEKRNGAATNIYRDNLNVESNPSRLVAVYGLNITNFRIQDLTIKVANAFGGGTSTYGTYLSGCSSYDLVRCKIYGGNAGNGSNAAAGSSGITGANGANGQNGDETGSCCNLGGVAPVSGTTFPGSNGGGDGGKGGDRGIYIQWFGGDAYNGDPGTPAPGVGAGIGGNGGVKVVTTVYPLGCIQSSNNDGGPGISGSNGFDGINGTQGIAAFTGGFYMPGFGTSGTDGTHGMGGGGGGGGGSLGGIAHDIAFGLPPNKNGTGAGGGSGGEGGQAGTGGAGASGGGASFALYLNSNGANANIIDCFLKAGSPGLGGLGGARGSGGAGGNGGDGGSKAGTCNIGRGGDGGDGGTGGNGGKGGNGSDGISYLFYEDTLGTPSTLMNINSLQQPFIFVKNSGCTNSPATFSTTATGSVTWYFGAGSVPASASGQTSTAYYSTTGRKTFTMINNGISYTYSEFVNVYSSGNGNNTNIQSTNTTICEGSTNSFTSSVTADNYEWIISGPYLNDTISGDSVNTISNYTFDSIGTYQIILKTFDNCCGFSFPDTTYLDVISIVAPSIVIQAEDSSNIFCDGANVTFSATSSNSGNLPTYQWLVNGASAGVNSSTFSSNALNDGDIISCTITSSKTCAVGLVDTSNSLSVSIIDYPTVTCTSDSFITGDPTSFTATVTAGGIAPFTYTWDFGDSTLGFGTSVDHIYQESGTYITNVSVVDGNGCIGNCSDVLTVSSILKAIFTSSDYTGCSGLSVQFNNFSTYAITYYWDFGDGTNSNLSNPVHVYNSPGNYSVTLKAFGGTGSSVSTTTNNITIYPSPTANFQAYPALVLSSQDTVFFSDNSISAIAWSWNFGDPSSGIKNTSILESPYHYYNSNGSYSVKLVVTNEFGCQDSLTKSQLVKIAVGLSEQPNGLSSVIIYPNPFNNLLNLNINVEGEGKMSAIIRNMQGQTITSINQIGMISGSNYLTINEGMSNLSSGVYFLEISFEGNTYYYKLIHNKD